NQAIIRVNLMRRVKVGANNFYWVAVLSVVNSFISAFGGGITFVVGLGLTQVVDALASIIARDAGDAALIAKGIGLVLSIVISGIIALFGYFAGKGQRWAFFVGMGLYGLDAILLLFFQDWLGFAFHLYFLWGLFTGLQALNQLQKLMPQPVSDFPKDIGVS
ncbi:MAG TPA: hypothetical protein VHM28_02205, partial [Anaerolineales bacterium]|nr:hypothetical protein [Anaerolineales bacterium]